MTPEIKNVIAKKGSRNATAKTPTIHQPNPRRAMQVLTRLLV